MGHSSPTTTIEYYLDQALLAYFGASAKDQLKPARDAWNALTANRSNLAPDQIGKIRAVITRLAAGAKDFEGVLDEMLADPELLPPAPTVDCMPIRSDPTTSGRSLLRETARKDNP